MTPLLKHRGGYSTCEGRHVPNVYVLPPPQEREPLSLQELALSVVLGIPAIPVNITIRVVKTTIETGQSAIAFARTMLR